MSYRYYKGTVVSVIDPDDANHERDGVIVHQSDDDPNSLVHFEDHRKVYHDSQIDVVPNRPMLGADEIKALPEVPLDKTPPRDITPTDDD